jgi:hypothetical protein
VQNRIKDQIYFFHILLNNSNLSRNKNKQTLGSGPGQATDYFVKNRYSITGLEIEEKQVQYLLEKYIETLPLSLMTI